MSINQPWHIKGNTYVRMHGCVTAFSSHFPSGNPTIGTSPPPLITVEVNRSICLVCDADGIIAPEINWLRESATLQSNAKDGYNITADSQNVRLSHFVVLDAKSSDSGMYQCTARNFINTTTEDFQISVVSPSECVACSRVHHTTLCVRTYVPYCTVLVLTYTILHGTNIHHTALY